MVIPLFRPFPPPEPALTDGIVILRLPREPDAPAIAAAAVRSGARALWLQFDTVDEEAAKSASEAGLDVVLDRCIMVEHRRLIS